MKKILFIILFFFIIQLDLLTQSTEKDKTFYQFYQRGNVFLKHKDYKEAAQEYQKAINENSSFPQLYMNLAICYDEGHETLLDYDKAINNYIKYLESGGPKIDDTKKIIKNIAQLKFATTESEFREIKQAVDLYNQGIELGKEKKYDTAIKKFNDALNIVPYYVKALYTLGLADFNTAHYLEAYGSFLKVIKLDADDPEFIEAYYYLGMLNDDLLIKDYDTALQFYNQYKEKNGNKPIDIFKSNIEQVNDLLNQAMALINNDKNFDQAVMTLEKALKIKPLDIRIYNNIGIAYLNKKDFNNAESYFNKALSIRKDVGTTYYNLACLYSIQNDVEKALASFKKGMQYFSVDDFENAAQDKDLNNLQQNIEFRKIIDYHNKGKN